MNRKLTPADIDQVWKDRENHMDQQETDDALRASRRYGPVMGQRAEVPKLTFETRHLTPNDDVDYRMIVGDEIVGRRNRAYPDHIVIDPDDIARQQQQFQIDDYTGRCLPKLDPWWVRMAEKIEADPDLRMFFDGAKVVLLLVIFIGVVIALGMEQ